MSFAALDTQQPFGSTNSRSHGLEVVTAHNRLLPRRGAATALSQAVPAELAGAVNAILATGGLRGQLQPLPLMRDVADATAKFVAFDHRDRPVAFVAFSPAAFPGAAGKAADASMAAAARLGTTLGAVVSHPWHVGTIDGRSWSIGRFEQPIADGRFTNWLGRRRLAPSLGKWLAAVATKTAGPPLVGADRDALVAALQRLADSAVSDQVATATREALADLECGRWQPRNVVAHNDLWAGNVLRPGHPAAGRPFVIIDWGAARLDGWPIYDLIRFSMSFGIKAKVTARHLGLHAKALGCTTEQTRHSLMAALAHLFGHLGEWPVDRFYEMAAACDRHWQAARPQPSGGDFACQSGWHSPPDDCSRTRQLAVRARS